MDEGCHILKGCGIPQAIVSYPLSLSNCCFQQCLLSSWCLLIVQFTPATHTCLNVYCSAGYTLLVVKVSSYVLIMMC